MAGSRPGYIAGCLTWRRSGRCASRILLQLSRPSGGTASCRRQYGSSAVVARQLMVEARCIKQIRCPPGHDREGAREMDLYLIRRRSNWTDAAALETTAAKSSAEGEKMSDEVRWIRSYVVEEEDGKLGTACIYEAVSPEAIRRHAGNTGMSADEITKVANTVVVREDPVTA